MGFFALSKLIYFAFSKLIYVLLMLKTSTFKVHISYLDQLKVGQITTKLYSFVNSYTCSAEAN